MTKLSDKQEVHLTHGVAHVLRAEEALVGFEPRLDGFNLVAHVLKQIFQQSL